MDDELRAELDAIDGDLIDCEELAAKDAQVRATHDVHYWRLLRANGIGRFSATLLTAVRAATD